MIYTKHTPWVFFSDALDFRQALDQASKYLFDEALSSIQAIEALRGGSDRALVTAFDIEVQLLKTMVLVELKKFDDALAIARGFESAPTGRRQCGARLSKGLPVHADPRCIRRLPPETSR